MSSKDSPERRLLSTKEAAEYLRVSERMVYRYRENGDLTPIKIGGRILFERTDLDTFVTRCRTKSAKDRCANTIRNVMALAPVMSAAQKRELAALLVQEIPA